MKRSVDEAGVSTTGGLDIMVNNAGVSHYGGAFLEEMTIEAIDETLNVNVRGMILSTRAAILYLPDGGRII